MPDAQEMPDPPDEPALPKRAYTGCIRVHAVTAEGARPVAGAAVTVVRFVSGEPELFALQTTGDSGETETMTVPAPPPSADQRHPASFLYDISVSADGYYREHSTDVPVFPGVTSVQTFVLIPLPAGGGTLSGGDLTYYNDMPQL
ncbi:MAG: carboxypeptidase regulatory-like domain-containing protein [Oscillospiraceae bacterium]|nr:carboxypeptidase regulatory-like domain-containing protein [Oscillospiraceae bacterium]